jgi:ATP-dependent exoDNAse (exonuclease V) alpha subunit
VPKVWRNTCGVTFARDRNLEREAVVEERVILRDALQRSLGETRVDEIKREVERRIQGEEFVAIEQKPGTPGRSFTTPTMIELERETIERMRAGQATQPTLASAETRRAIARDHHHLSESQRAAVDQILSSRDQVTALEGTAGSGKTTALAAVRDAAEREGYQVEGFAPTSRAAQKLNEAGITASTLQHHLARTEEEPRTAQKQLYVLDESSLASTKQMHTFLQRLRTDDRVLLVGDVRQHEAVDAGRPYRQLQETGVATARLDDVVPQKDPALKAIVERLSRGEVRSAIEQLDSHGRVHEIADREERFNGIAREYVRNREGTLVVSPDNQSRMDINQVIHRAMQNAGLVDQQEHRVRVLIARQEITGADRQWAEQYDPSDVVRYAKGSKTLGLDAGEYARVEHVTAKDNLVTVRRNDGERITYDPRRLQGVTLYRETDRAFATGDRVQFTAPDRQRHVANRELATIETIDAGGQLRLSLDSGRRVALPPGEHRHLDYGYAVTSHSSQGQTADRVLVHVDTGRAGEQLINRRFAYVAVSRGRYDAQIYTNDKARLADTLGREASHRSALEPSVGPQSGGRSIEPTAARRESAEQTTIQSFGH